MLNAAIHGCGNVGRGARGPGGGPISVSALLKQTISR